MSTAVSASTNVFAETCACGPKLFPTLSSEQYHETYNSLGHIDDVGAHNINQGVALTKSLLYQAGLGPFIVSHIGITRLHKHFDIASHEVVVSELSPCRSKMTSSVKNICDVGSEHVPMTWAYRQGAWRRIQLLRLPEETVEDGGISGNLRKQAADCETQLMRMIDGSAGLGMREIYVEAQTKRIVANGASSVTRRADTAKGPKTRSQAWSLRLTAWACCSLNHAPRASRAS
jgi:hypothetical protein